MDTPNRHHMAKTGFAMPIHKARALEFEMAINLDRLVMV